MAADSQGNSGVKVWCDDKTVMSLLSLWAQVLLLKQRNISIEDEDEDDDDNDDDDDDDDGHDDVRLRWPTEV